MPSQDMSLEELGLLQLLEKISGNAGAAIDRFARYGLVQAGLITEGEPPRLTESGVAFARRYRVPLYNASRRKAVLEAEEHERRGAEVLRYAARVARR